ncbi:MAG: hypothetical protein LRZ87_00245 [Methanocellales archaeon]|nr:hypothetical protein [Methanocellales archaeon]
MSLYHDESGVTVIIGTLLLILITVTAAAGFALMVSELQEEEMARRERIIAVEGENLRIVSIDHVQHIATHPRLGLINITIHNLDINPSHIIGIALNDGQVINFTAKDGAGNFITAGGANEIFNFTNRLSIPGGGVRTVHINLTCQNDFKGAEITNNETFEIAVMTSHINIFRRVFAPPVPLVEVEFDTERIVDANGNVTYRNFLILDASRSFDPDPDDFITAYRWAVWNNTELIYDYNLTGRMVRPMNLNLTTAQDIRIDLEIEDNTGMTSKLSQRSGNIIIPN